MKIKRETLILILIFLLGALIRIYLSCNETFIGSDAVVYTRLGKNLIESGRYLFGENSNLGIYFPPGYPVFVGLINLFLKDLFISGKMVSLFFSLISIFLFYSIGKELDNRESGLFAAFAYAIYPTSIIVTTLKAQSEGTFFFFIFFSIYLFMVSKRRNSFFIYASLGLSIGIAYLTRPEGLLLLLLPFLTFVDNNPLKNKRYLFKVCVAFMTFILIISPYLLFLKRSTGEFKISGKQNMGMAIERDANIKSKKGLDETIFSLNKEKTQLRFFNTGTSIFSYIFKNLFENPSKFIKHFLNNVKDEIEILGIGLIPIILPLFFSFFRRDLFKKKNMLLFILFPFLFGGLYSLFPIQKRFMGSMVLSLILFSSVGFANSQSAFSNIFDFCKIKRNKIILFLEKHIKYIIIIMLILSSFLYYAVFRSKSEIPTEHIKAGYFLKNNISSEYEKLNIMSLAPWISFYSDSRFTYLPYANYSDMINFAKLYHVDYIVVDERLLSEWDFYDEFLHMEKYSDDVKLIYEDNSGKLIKMFKVNY